MLLFPSWGWHGLPMGVCKGRTQQPGTFPLPRHKQNNQGTGAAPVPGIGHLPGD